jgi:hypothetical protein
VSWTRSKHAGRMTAACSAPVEDPVRLLAIAVLGIAIDDAASGGAVVVDAEWADLAGVEPFMLTERGVRVWEIVK